MKKIALILSVVFCFTLFPMFSGCGEKDNKITEYDIDINLSGNVVEGRVEVDFFNHTDNVIKELKFNLFANAFRGEAKVKPILPQYKNKAYYNGESFGCFKIESVMDEKSALKYEICGEDENILSVQLLGEVYPDESYEVEIEYSIDLAYVIARTGINLKTINLANFYPILCALDNSGFYECVYYPLGDPYYSDCANYEVSITFDSEFIVASSGEIVESKENANLTTNTYEISNARSFAFVLSREYESISKKVNDVEITYYYYDDETPEKSLEYAEKSMKTFSELFGKYPYKTYAVCQTEFVEGGMEFPGLVMISHDVEKPAYGEVIVHETAHQWWQTGVGNNEIEHAFLDEGLAEYSVVLFFENNQEYNVSKNMLLESSLNTYKTYYSVIDKLFGKVDTCMDRSLNEFSGEYEYVCVVYVKSVIMYDTLRQTIGDELFFKGLKKYYKDFCYKNATPEDLVGTFEKIGADSNGFFDSFVNGKVIL